jgi:KaiC/GvpD/RAD55 family RecA-like ATPase
MLRAGCGMTDVDRCKCGGKTTGGICWRSGVSPDLCSVQINLVDDSRWLQGTAAQSEPQDGEDGDLAEIAAAFTPVDWHAAWEEQPEEIQWLIEPLIEAGQSVALFAEPGTGKSLIALELAAALATGRPVLGNPAREPMNVVYIDVENRQPSLVERLQAYGYKPDDLGRLILFSFPSIAALDSLLGGQQILALAVTHQAAIVIIDTTSRVVAGKENDADTYHALYRHTVIPLRKREIALLRLDHPGKNVSRGARGSSAKKGDVDAEWLLAKLSENTFSLDRQKERDNHGDPRIGLRRRFEPLRHEVTSGSGDRAAELAAELDRLNVPPGTGRVIAGKALRDAGIKVRAKDLAAALRRRKTVPLQPTLDGIESGSQTVGTAGNRTPDSDPGG